MKRLVKSLVAVIAITHIGNITALAETNGYGAGVGREDTVNINDYSTSSWDRFEYNYEFETGVNYKEELGRPTQTDIVPRNPQNENVRRNKDVTFIPPAYGVFSGEIDSNRSNPYMTPDVYQYARENSNYNDIKTYDTLSQGINGASSSSEMLAPTSVGYNNSGTSGNSVTINPNSSTGSSSSSSSNSSGNSYSGSVTYENSYRYERVITEVSPYSDGSIGLLKIQKLGLSVKIYEGETLDNMKKGVGHFEHTSQWDGNIGLAGHNGGSSGYFEDVKNLILGDKITYETSQGKRTYEVTSKTVISSSDFSYLGYSTDNRITLITCVKNSPNERLVVQAIEI